MKCFSKTAVCKISLRRVSAFMLSTAAFPWSFGQDPARTQAQEYCTRGTSKLASQLLVPEADLSALIVWKTMDGFVTSGSSQLSQTFNPLVESDQNAVLTGVPLLKPPFTFTTSNSPAAHKGQMVISIVPWQVAVLNKSESSPCGGVLLSQQIVLTAAHCLSDKHFSTPTNQMPSLSEIKVIVGERILKADPKKELSVVSPALSVGYNKKTFENDWVLLKLSSPVSSDKAAPIDLYSGGLPSGAPSGASLCIAGWGATSLFSGSSNAYLNAAPMFPMDDVACNSKMKDFKDRVGNLTIKNGMKCAYGGIFQTGFTGGDSGSGVYTDDNGTPKLVGIASWTSKDRKPDVPSVYSDVHYFRAAILEGVKKLEALKN